MHAQMHPSTHPLESKPQALLGKTVKNNKK